MHNSDQLVPTSPRTYLAVCATSVQYETICAELLIVPFCLVMSFAKHLAI